MPDAIKSGDVRSANICIKPISVPNIPKAGAKVPQVLNSLEYLLFVSSTESISSSKMDLISLISNPSIHSSNPFFINGSSIPITSLSIDKRPSFLAFLESVLNCSSKSNFDTLIVLNEYCNAFFISFISSIVNVIIRAPNEPSTVINIDETSKKFFNPELLPFAAPTKANTVDTISPINVSESVFFIIFRS